MKNIMKRAWEIAKDGQKNFGGKVSEYLGTAMKMAWNEWKGFKSNVEKLKNINAKAKAITRKEIIKMDFDKIVEQSKGESIERFNRAISNIKIMVEKSESKLNAIKWHRGLA